jgi:hypothetical protein
MRVLGVGVCLIGPVMTAQSYNDLAAKSTANFRLVWAPVRRGFFRCGECLCLAGISSQTQPLAFSPSSAGHASGSRSTRLPAQRLWRDRDNIELAASVAMTLTARKVARNASWRGWNQERAPALPSRP